MDNIRFLEQCSQTLSLYIENLKGNHRDLTGMGLRAIFLSQLEGAMNIKIIGSPSNTKCYECGDSIDPTDGYACCYKCHCSKG